MNPSVQHDDQRFLGLLEKWQSGDFTRADEQQLNALTASDNFRREAMEGFMSLPETEHEARLHALRARLRERTGRRVGGRRFALPAILTAAATVALLLTAIWFFPTLNKDDAAPIAQQQEEPADSPRSSESAPSSETPDDGQIAMQQPTAKPIPPSSGSSSTTLSDRVFSGPSVKEDAPDFATTDEKAAELDDSKLTNIVVAPQTSPPTPARSAPAGEGIALDKSAPTESAKPAQPARDVATKPAAKAKKRAQTADSIWHDTDRKPDMDAERKKIREEAQAQQSEPADGWEAFREYLRQNARLTPEARNRNVSGTVQLQFNVNENGEPTGFVVLRALGYGCDQEAIRLVQNWEWVRGKNPIVTVDVPFVR